MAKKWSKILGIVFLLIGVLGFIPNPLVGMNGLFHADMAHNLVHIITGLVLLFIAMKKAGSAPMALKVLGVVYLLLAILGFLTISGEGPLLGFISVNSADNWLHLVLGALLLGIGLKAGKRSSGMSMPESGMGTPSQPMM